LVWISGNKRDYKLWRERQGVIDNPEQPDFESIYSGYYVEIPTLGERKPKGSGRYGEDIAMEQLEQAKLARDRIIEPEREVHFGERYEGPVFAITPIILED